MRQIFTLISCLTLFFISSAQTTKSTEKTSIVFRCRAIPSSSPEPLLVIDGVLKDKFDLKEIDPNNIESIEILKDASAQAIYGCRAAQGVIIIATKTANRRVIKVKDILSGELLPGATVELAYKENNKDTSLCTQTDSVGCLNTNKIVYGKEYELKVSSVGYKAFKRIVTSEIIGKDYSVLLERNYCKLEEVIVGADRTRTIRCGGIIRVVKNSSYEETFAEQNSFRMYPNPVVRNQKINMEFASENEQRLIMQLFGIDSKLINSKEYPVTKGINKFDYVIDTKLTSGLYIVQIFDTNDKLIRSEKLVIQ